MKIKYTPEETQEMWEKLMGYIDTYISEPRKEKLILFYNKFKDRILFMPASHRAEYHNAHVSGYIDHVLRVIDAALDIHNVWVKYGVDTTTYTIEELVFSALNHDLGKMGDQENEAYIPQTDQWRKEKLGEDYKFNDRLEYMSVPDRGLYLLNEHGISYSKNELLAIKLHDGLYDEANKPYLMTWMPETKPRTSLIYIIHQADLLAARVEFEREWLPKLKSNLSPSEKNFTITEKKSSKVTTKAKALGSIKSDSLKNMLDNL